MTRGTGRPTPVWRPALLGLAAAIAVAAPAAADELLLLRQRVVMLEQAVRELSAGQPMHIERVHRLEARVEALRLELEAIRAEVSALAGMAEPREN